MLFRLIYNLLPHLHKYQCYVVVAGKLKEMTNQEKEIKLKKRLEKIEKELELVRGCSPITDGWQTQRYAKKSRKWDMLAQEKMNIKKQLDEIDFEEAMKQGDPF